LTARVLFVGWDGADWDVLGPIQERGGLPTLESLRRSGADGTLGSTFPPHSVAAWASFLTAMPADGHLMVDFLRAAPGRAFPEIPNGSLDLPRPTLLDVLSRAGRRVLSANIPMTFPPFEVNGAMIAGVFVPEGARFTSPPELQDWLRSRGGFRANAMQWTRSGSLSALLQEARGVTESHTEHYVSLLRREEWDVALFGFMEPDRVQHAGMHLLDARHPANPGPSDDGVDRVVDVFHGLDRALGRLVEAAEPEHVVVASDHGFRPVWRDAVPNAILERAGFLARKATVRGMRRMLGPLRRVARAGVLRAPVRRVLGVESEIDWGRTRAYAPSGTCSGVRLNVAGRDPHGIVPSARFDATLETLMSELREALTPDGEPCFSSVIRAAEVAPGLAERPGVPDAFYVPSPGLGVSMQGASPFRPSGRKSGEHRREGVVVRGDLGPVPRDIWELPRLLTDLAGVPREAWTIGSNDAGPDGSAPSDDERESIIGHLRGLGYVE
jgi:predicted AlkP superfamily phosphohydrolase/phosphomutase